MIVFLGDSITQWWDPTIFKQHFERYTPINLGVSGYTTKDVIELLELSNLHNIKPEIVILQIGTNNADHGITTGETFDDIQKILDLLFKIVSRAKILVVGLLPRGFSPSDKHRVYNNEVNKLLASATFRENVFYVDTKSTFLMEDETISNKIMYDFLHLTVEGYTYLSELLSGFLFLLNSFPSTTFSERTPT